MTATVPAPGMRPNYDETPPYVRVEDGLGLEPPPVPCFTRDELCAAWSAPTDDEPEPQAAAPRIFFRSHVAF